MDTPLNPPAAQAQQGTRPLFIAAGGILVIMISLAAALLPLAGGLPAAAVVGTMMIAAGVAEAAAGSLRSQNRVAAMLPGAVTLAAGLLFSAETFESFIAMVHLVTGWLAARAAVLLIASLEARGRVRLWTLIAAVTDLSLAAILLIGLSATAFPIALFGVSRDIIGGFAWVLALSFVVTGVLLLEIAASEASEEARNQRRAS